jgi:hypothetical protein
MPCARIMFAFGILYMQELQHSHQASQMGIVSYGWMMLYAEGLKPLSMHALIQLMAHTTVFMLKMLELGVEVSLPICANYPLCSILGVNFASIDSYDTSFCFC